MKKITQYVFLVVIFIVIWKCQLLKEPAAKVMSTTLPTPELDSSHVSDQFPKADFNLHVKDLSNHVTITKRNDSIKWHIDKYISSDIPYKPQNDPFEQFTKKPPSCLDF